MQTRQPRSYIAHEDGHIRSVPRDQQQAAQLRPPRRPGRDFLKSAENVDIDNAGRLRSRPGVTLIQAMTGAHSLFLTSDTAGYLVRASSLYAITLPTYTETLVKALSGNTAMSYVVHAGEVYCSRCNAGTAAGGINLLSHSATYACGTRAFHNDGQLAGRRLSGIHELQEQLHRRRRRISPPPASRWRGVGGIVVTLPATTTGATHVNVYLSRTNGGVPYLLASVAVGTATYTATALATGRRLPAGLKCPSLRGRCSLTMPGCAVFPGIRFISGCRIALDTAWRWTASCRFLPLCRLPFPGRTASMWSPTRPTGFPTRGGGGCSSYGAVSGTAFSLPNSSEVGWSRGGRDRHRGHAGNVKPLTAGSITSPRQTPAFPCVFDGEYTRVVSCGWCVNLESGAATRYAGLGFHVLVSELRDEGRQLVRDERGRVGLCVCRVRGSGFRGWSAKADSRMPTCLLIRRPVAGHACSGRGTPTTTTRDRARNHSGLNGWILAVG